jgi:hypothetical protein
MEKALEFLSETDRPYAEARSYYHGLVEQKPVIKAIQHSQSRAPTEKQKEQQAYQSMAYQQHLEKMEKAHLDFLSLETNRMTAQVVIDVWRSLNAARSKGILT